MQPPAITEVVASAIFHLTRPRDTLELMRELPTGTVTFLFTDIEGSTRLLHELGDRYAELLTEHGRLVREACEQYGGRVVDTQGDSFFVAFGDARDAVTAAAQLQTALAKHGWPDGVAVRVRMGVHTGEPLVVDMHYVGIDVHRAARIGAAGASAASTCATGTPVIFLARRGRSICSQRDTRLGSVETMTSS